MQAMSSFIKSNEEVKTFFSSYAKQDYETLANLLLVLGIRSLSKYSKLNIAAIRTILNSDRVVAKTEEDVAKLRENIKALQSTIVKLEESLKGTGKIDKACGTNEPEVKGKFKKVDFWNQTNEKENENPEKLSRSTWNRNTELNWVHDYSREVKRMPKTKSPMVIRESRISILSNNSKSRISSIDEIYLPYRNFELQASSFKS